ncbi:hypothetical protein K490DRAFT_58762 [Saccharata proteae CBS 121410]|uniref:Uncharacterized protein n=1 Tax=Saccharata proteae CBS 121410 TaxID=1314787 RepID=A0A9P4LUX0_9PEZI|nr:hypothetical protein K490DRAFT_58762 [Saccharata proteae CBS 121410]
MAFRERVKRVLGRGSSSNSSTSSLSKQSTHNRRDSNVYQPGEKMPPMKYRRPVQKEHKEKLESFQFAQSWRRKSEQSQYSPMGSRIPSRMGSMKSRKSTHASRSQVVEGADDDTDVANVGLSPQRTNEDSRYRPIDSAHARQSKPAADSRPETSSTGDGASNGSTGQQNFTQQDLNLALKRSRIEVPPS